MPMNPGFAAFLAKKKGGGKKEPDGVVDKPGTDSPKEDAAEIAKMKAVKRLAEKKKKG